MGKTRNLNGLPKNLLSSYLSTLGYYENGYMADWINYIARKEGITNLKIDILNNSIEPKVAEIKSLLAHLDKMKHIIYSELVGNKFDSSFIKKAIFKFEIPIEVETNKIYCYSILEDVNGKIYDLKEKMVETAYETNFKPLLKIKSNRKVVEKSFLEKVKQFFK